MLLNDHHIYQLQKCRNYSLYTVIEYILLQSCFVDYDYLKVV